MNKTVLFFVFFSLVVVFSFAAGSYYERQRFFLSYEGNVVGQYFPFEKTIVVMVDKINYLDSPFDYHQGAISVFFHELGHYDWFVALTEQQRNDYSFLHSDKNVVEFYAEEYSRKWTCYYNN